MSALQRKLGLFDLGLIQRRRLGRLTLRRGLRRVNAGKCPVNAPHLARVPVDDDLDRAPRTVGARQEDALLELNAILVRVEGPYFAVRQHQHHAMAVGQPVPLDRRMQMETHGKIVCLPAREAAPVGTKTSSPSRRLPPADSISAR